MTYVNVGVWSTDTGDRIPTKKALKLALVEQPAAVVFDKTSMLDSSGLPEKIHGDSIPDGVKLSVCGPDPYTKRNWWATVEKKPDGSLKVA